MFLQEDEEGIEKYQMMIGCLHWVVSLGGFYIQTATITMSRFQVTPRLGHLNQLKRIHEYLKKFARAAIYVRLLEPDLGNVKELLPKDALKPLGKPVPTITYTDANLYHDMLTGISATGIFHLCNQTLIDCYSKQQATFETATFGSELTAAQIAVDQIIDLQTTLQYHGLPVH
jgi:hypothetical protein